MSLLPAFLLSASAALAAPKHVVLVSVDTLRADHIGAYGSDVKTPHMDRMAREGALFEYAIATAPTTLASHTSMMTGMHAHTHGAPRNGFVVADDNVMLAELLSGAGFTTAGFIGARPLHSETRFHQGFGHFDDEITKAGGEKHYWRDGRYVVQAVDEWLDGGGKDSAHVFMFVHLFDVHAPYRPPEPWRTMYDPPDVPGEKLSGSARHVKAVSKMGTGPETKVHHDALARQYAGGVSYADDLLGRLRTSLESHGIWDDALIIVTSDHGENHATHAEHLWDHGATVYDTTQHVPLIVTGGGAKPGTRVGGVVSGVDIFPTVLDAVGQPVPDSAGLSLVPLMKGGSGARHPTVFAEATKPSLRSHPRWLNEPLDKAARTASHKVIWNPKDKDPALYDLRADPGEQRDLADQADLAGVRDGLVEQLEAYREAAQPLPAVEVGTEDVQEALKALGYVE